MTDKAKLLFSDVLIEYEKFNHGGIWIFGDDTGPTVLDTHIVPFIVRLIDIHLKELVPSQMLTYAKSIMGLSEWNEVMQGRPTVWNSSLGSVDQL
jgi:hypothetical protein